MSAIFRNVGLLSGLIASTICAAGGTLPANRKQPAPQASQTAPVQEAVAAVPEPPPVPEQRPASPPNVTMNGGQLSIIADNSTLGDVLNAVKKLTGAGIELPTAASRERIVAQLGPGQPQQVLEQLLTGSRFDYIILGSADNPDGIQRIILTPRGAAGNSSSGPGNVPPTRTPMNNQPAFASQPEQDSGVEDEIQQEPPEPMQPEPPPPQTEEPQQQQQPGMPPNNQNGPKTPEQLLQELQRLQQQGQAGRPPQEQ